MLTTGTLKRLQQKKRNIDQKERNCFHFKALVRNFPRNKNMLRTFLGLKLKKLYIKTYIKKRVITQFL